jgi:hypothetical protein
MRIHLKGKNKMDGPPYDPQICTTTELIFGESERDYLERMQALIKKTDRTGLHIIADTAIKMALRYQTMWLDEVLGPVHGPSQKDL